MSELEIRRILWKLVRWNGEGSQLPTQFDTDSIRNTFFFVE